jgi:aminopeptidase-like protein
LGNRPEFLPQDACKLESHAMSEFRQPRLNAHNQIGQEMHQWMARLYPICRSITGNGLRESLRIIGELIPLEFHEVPSGTPVFDWIIPKEWNITDAYIKNSDGERVVDFRVSNLHVVSYSIPVKKTMSLEELKPHLHSIPEYPDRIPYRTSYYKEDWGFCLADNTLRSLAGGEYEVMIDSTLEPGSLTYGELLVKGQSEEEVLISCHSCHPSLCNDNLSGMALTAYLARYLRSFSGLRYSYRFLFIPVTIGSICWLSTNENKVEKIKHGLVVAGVGDPGKLTYKKSRQGDAEIDRAALRTLIESGQEFDIQDFSPYGYDERQYCSPGFGLPIGSLTRTPYGRYPEYHTSADNLQFVRPEYLEDSFMKYANIINILEHNRKFINTNPKCEPQLGKRGLYKTYGGRKENDAYELTLLWVLNLSDGSHSLLDIAERSGQKFELIRQVTEVLQQNDLLVEHQEQTATHLQ